MAVHAVCLAKDEPWIGEVIDHLWAEGVDTVTVEVDEPDQTAELALAHKAQVALPDEPGYYQSARTTRLAASVASVGDWVIPFDADEFWYSDHGPLKTALERVDAVKCYARMFLHRDADHRRKEPKPLPKVAFRWFAGAVIADGNHDVNLPGGVWGVVDLREIQYRSLDHLKAKVEKTRALHRITPGLPEGFGFHMRQLAAMNDQELEDEWVRMNQGEWWFDPIPSR